MVYTLLFALLKHNTTFCAANVATLLNNLHNNYNLSSFTDTELYIQFWELPYQIKDLGLHPEPNALYWRTLVLPNGRDRIYWDCGNNFCDFMFLLYISFRFVLKICLFPCCSVNHIILRVLSLMFVYSILFICTDTLGASYSQLTIL